MALDSITLGTLWGILPTAIAIYYFIKQFKKSARDEGNVDIEQDAKILEIQGEIKLLKVELKHLQIQVNENKADTKEELMKIYNKLEDISKLLIDMQKKTL